jgi:hypothetical protein
MSTTNQALLLALQSPMPPFVNDDSTANVGGGQVAKTLRSTATRFVKVGTAGDSAVLPSLSDHQGASGFWYVLNDDPSDAMSVFAGLGDSLNGTPNGSLSIAAGGFAIFLRIDSTGWSAAAFT